VHAGCEYGDLADLVEREGLEAALLTLYRAGVYLTVEELKGRRPIVRGSLKVGGPVQNPTVMPHGLARTSGSRGPSMSVPISLPFVAEMALDMRLTLDAWGAGPWRLAYWDVPGTTVFFLLAYAKCGVPVARWFSPVDPADATLAARYRWSARAVRWASRAAGVTLPHPETVPIHAPLEIARWIAATRTAGATPLLLTYSSPAIRLCRAAAAAGLDLAGAQLRLYGEPVTATRLDVIRRSGADARAICTTAEAWRIGEPCLEPEAPDEVHLVDDVHALIQPGSADSRPDVPPDALLLTSLRPRAPVLFLNTSLGDEAVVTTRRCGCALERVGWGTHLSRIRSYEKLTAAGMTFLDWDVIRILDDVLPSRFGGGPTDYQVVEDEAVDGRPRIRLLVHPAVGSLDSDAVVRAFLDAIGAGSGAARMMARVWGDADVVTLERRPPVATATGKILHLHARGGTALPGPDR
jgi:hypothetical protein